MQKHDTSQVGDSPHFQPLFMQRFGGLERRSGGNQGDEEDKVSAFGSFGFQMIF